jgi:hypothetical protein
MKKIFLSAIFILTLAAPISAAAQGNVDVFQDACQGAQDSAACKGKNAIITPNNPGINNPVYGPDGVLTKVINIISIVVGIAAVIGIIAAGVKFITSGNNPEEVAKAREYIQYALIALILVGAAQAMVKVVLFRIGVT